VRPDKVDGKCSRRKRALYGLRGKNYYRINFGCDNAWAMRLKCVLGECVHSHIFAEKEKESERERERD